MEGRRLGRYRITSKLAEGGMGAVYLATHELMDREVVVKVLLPEMSTQREIVQRFFNEARATGNLNHPGIVAIFDLDYADDGRAYIVMERLQGETLDQRIKRVKRLSVEQTLDVARQLASALGAAHGKGIVHRDLKPGNIFLVEDPEIPGRERVKVLDFGVAKLALQRGSLVTHQGTIFGTPPYMAPEQCVDAAMVDHRADLYALGCILYECLCGRPPFVGSTIEVLASQLRDVPAPPRALDPSLPPWLDSLIVQLLQKEPGDRIQSCAALVAAINGSSASWAAQPGMDGSAHAPVNQAGANMTRPQWTQAGGHARRQDAPTHAHRGPAQPSHQTTGSIAGSAAEMQLGTGGRKRRVWLGVAGLVLGFLGLGLYLGFDRTGRDGTGADGPGTGSQPGIAAVIDAGKEPIATAGEDVATLLQEAQAALEKRDWSVARIKGREALELAGADASARERAQQVIDRATAEEASKMHSEALLQAAERKDYAKLKEHYAAIDAQSAYHAEARAAHDAARDAYVEEVLRQAGALGDARNCKQLRVLQKEAAAQWAEAGERVGEILEACKPGTSSGSLGGMSGDESTGLGIGSASGETRRDPEWMINEPLAARKLEKLVSEAEEAAKKGMYGLARRNCSQALEIEAKGSDGRALHERAITTCAIAACNLDNEPLAKRYYQQARSQLLKSQIYQICRSKGIEVRR